MGYGELQMHTERQQIRYAAQVHSLCASMTAVYLPFLVFGGVLTRLDQTTERGTRTEPWLGMGMIWGWRFYVNAF